MKRRISAILAADIVGYSRLTAEDEEETVRRLAVCREMFDESTAESGGRVVNMVGDAFLAEFPSALDAIRCAIYTQDSFRINNLDFPSSREMALRIGITVGDVIDRDGQIFGDGVNIAARLESLSPPGGICVSRTVYEQVVDELSAEFVDIGEQSVKNIAAPIHAYMILPYRRIGNVEDVRSQSAKQQRYRVAVGSAIVTAVLAASLAIALQIYGRP
jgi:adenylate cyclase